MKKVVHPNPPPVASGEPWPFSRFIREIVLTRPLWRGGIKHAMAHGHEAVRLQMAIDAKLEEDPTVFTEREYEVLCSDATMPDLSMSSGARRMVAVHLDALLSAQDVDA